MRTWYVWPAVLCLLLGGCLGRGEFVPVRYYSLDGPPSSLPQSRRTWDLTLGVRPFTAATRYGERMLYRRSEVEVGFYDYDRWVEPPAEMVTHTITEMVRAVGLFRQVVEVEHVQLSAWILSGELLRFDDVRDANPRRAECWLWVELVRARDEQLLWSQVIKASVPVGGESPAAFARAMRQAVQQVGHELIRALDQAALPPS